MKNPAPFALGIVWGLFSLFFSLFVLFVLVDPQEIGPAAEYVSLAACLYAWSEYSAFSFAAAAYLVAFCGFAFSLLGIIGAGLSRRHGIAGGILLLISCAGVFALYFWPFLFGYSSAGFTFSGVLGSMGSFETGVVIIALLTPVVATLGIVGGIVSFTNKQHRFDGPPHPPYPPFAPLPPDQPAAPQSPVQE